MMHGPKNIKIYELTFCYIKIAYGLLKLRSVCVCVCMRVRMSFSQLTTSTKHGTNVHHTMSRNSEFFVFAIQHYQYAGR